MGTNGGELGETQATWEESDLIWVTEEGNDLCGELTTGARPDEELARLRADAQWRCHAAISPECVEVATSFSMSAPLSLSLIF